MEVVHVCPVGSEALAFLLDNGCRGVIDESPVTELALRFP
jgi:hypothetical protein